jgi:hypothetical protein
VAALWLQRLERAAASPADGAWRHAVELEKL